MGMTPRGFTLAALAIALAALVFLVAGTQSAGGEPLARAEAAAAPAKKECRYGATRPRVKAKRVVGRAWVACNYRRKDPLTIRIGLKGRSLKPRAETLKYCHFKGLKRGKKRWCRTFERKRCNGKKQTRYSYVYALVTASDPLTYRCGKQD